MDVLTGVEVQRRRARVVAWLLAGTATLSVAGLLSNVAQLALLGSAEAGGVDVAEAIANDPRAAGIAAAQTVTFVVTALAWLRWEHRAYANLKLLGERRSGYGTAWALGCWFVPFVNIFAPYQIMRELLVRSRGTSGAPGAAQRVPPLLQAWWTAWIMANVLGQVSVRLSESAVELSALQAATSVDLAADAVTALAAVAAAAVVRQIDAHQRAASLGAHAVAAFS